MLPEAVACRPTLCSPPGPHCAPRQAHPVLPTSPTLCCPSGPALQRSPGAEPPDKVSGCANPHLRSLPLICLQPAPESAGTQGERHTGPESPRLPALPHELPALTLTCSPAQPRSSTLPPSSLPLGPAPAPPCPSARPAPGRSWDRPLMSQSAGMEGQAWGGPGGH